MNSTLKDCLPEKDRQDFLKQLTSEEDWLYDNLHGKKKVFVDRLADLKKIGDPAAQRLQDFHDRPSFLESFKHVLKSGEDFVKHRITEEAKSQPIFDHLEKESKWLENKLAEQEKISPPMSKTVISCKEIKDREEKLKIFIMQKDQEAHKKPEPPPVSESENTENGNKNEDKSEEKEAEKSAVDKDGDVEMSEPTSIEQIDVD